MCWVALDRALKIGKKQSLPGETHVWYEARNEIFEEVMKRGWSQKRQALVQAYDGDTLDAANLFIPAVSFLSPTDPRILKTLDAVSLPPNKGGLVSNSLVYRYNVDLTQDGLTGDEGTFNICSFLLVSALTKAARVAPSKLNEARLMFEKILSYGNHLGLYAEETGPSGEALGNFPQAFTHLALIGSAVNLNEALESGRPRYAAA
jgi:GH15 family glucan-1,4-alpha-glucosidase